MAYITPNSTIYLLKNVPFDRSYNHTVKWANATVQLNTLKATPYLKYTLTEQSYQRWKRDYIRVAMKCDLLYDCNYLIFQNTAQNTAYGNKWFYAFLDEPVYVNDNCTEIHYTIDVMQTWMFDIEVPPCFVEREHSLSDNIGDNLVPENLETGELLVNSSSAEYFEYMLAGIVTTKKLPSNQYLNIGGQRVLHLQIETQYMPEDWSISQIGTYSPANGVPSGMYVAYGFPVSDDDITSFWNPYGGYYNLQNYNLNQSDKLTIGKLLQLIGEGLINSDTPIPIVSGSPLSSEDIVAVYLYPGALNRKSNMETAEETEHYKKGTAMHYIQKGTRPYEFMFKDGTNYTPKNNKLFTFPYVQLSISNNSGEMLTLRYEETNGANDAYGHYIPYFTWVGTFVNKPMVLLYPLDYKNEEKNFEYSLSISDFPSPQYKGSQYARWMEENANKMNFGVLSSVVGSLANIGMGLAAPMPPQLVKRATEEHHAEYSSNDIPMAYNRIANAASGGLNIANEIGSSLAKVQDLRNAPPSIYGNYNNDVLNLTTNRTGFRFYSMAIRGEFAQQIDDYFSMFGYATKRVKVPNVFSSNTTHRRYWNYLNTKGALVKSKADTTGVPAFDLEQIQNILDKGITFWNTIGQIGKYNLNNSIVTQ